MVWVAKALGAIVMLCVSVSKGLGSFLQKILEEILINEG